ncbi:MAG: T9SS type A sorting domain-containing protein [Bacteroidota bacterium]
MQKHLLIIVCLLYGCFANAQTAIDSTFGTNGYASSPRLEGKDAKRLVMLEGGSFLVVGNIFSSNGRTIISKYTKDGQLDTKFGTFGIRTIILKANNYFNPEAVVLSKDSMLIIGLRNYDYATSRSNIVLLKTNLKGQVDTAFGDSGFLAIPSDKGYIQQIDAMVVDRNGNILMSYLRDIGDTKFRSVLRRYKANGELDTLFQQKGELRMYKYGDVVIQHLAITKDNRYLISYMLPASPTIQAEPRDSNGNIIPNDPLNGKIRIDYGYSISRYSYGLIIDKDENIFTYTAYGDLIRFPTYSTVKYTYLSLYKYDKLGNPIRSFGSNSLVAMKLHSKYCLYGIRGMTIDSKGRFIFAVNYIDTSLDNGTNYPFDNYNSIVHRLTPNGRLDSTFNETGRFEDFKEGEFSDELKDIALQADDKIIATGLISEIDNNYRQFICRFNERSPGTSIIRLTTNESPTITTYPSPFNTSLTLSGISQPFNYAIHNTLGQLVFSGYSDNATIDNLGFLLQGLYTLTVNDGNKVTVIKIVKG